MATNHFGSNGQPWPYLEVKPCKYRFRVLDGAVSRGKSDHVIYIVTSVLIHNSIRRLPQGRRK